MVKKVLLPPKVIPRARPRPVPNVSNPDTDGWQRYESRRARKQRLRESSRPRRPVPEDLRGRCFNCFSSSHRAAACRAEPRCFKCRRDRASRFSLCGAQEDPALCGASQAPRLATEGYGCLIPKVVDGLAGVPALRDRMALPARMAMTAASPLRPLLLWMAPWSIPLASLLGIDVSLTARPRWPELKMTCDVLSLFRLLETWQTSRWTLWLMSLLVAMSSRSRS